MPSIQMQPVVDPRGALLSAVGDVTDFEIAHNEVLVAIYRRPEKTRGGIVLPRSNLDEDLNQSKAALVVKIGKNCTFGNFSVAIGDWVVVRTSDTWQLEVNFVPCRLVFDDQIRARIQRPDMVW